MFPPGGFRAAIHVFNRYMAQSSSRARHAPGKAVQQFLNCLLGGKEKVSKRKMSNGMEKRVEDPRFWIYNLAAVGEESQRTAENTRVLPREERVVMEWQMDLVACLVDTTMLIF